MKSNRQDSMMSLSALAARPLHAARFAAASVLLLSCIGLWSLPGMAHASDHSIVTLWDAATFLAPTELPIGYSLTDTADPEDAIIAGGVMTLATSEDIENLGFTHSGAQLTMPDDLVIETRMRLVSGASSSNARGPAIIGFTPVPPSFGNDLHIDIDEVFLLSGNNTRGPTAFVDTDDSFHTYRIEVSGGAITVYQDAVQILTGSTFDSASHNGTVTRVHFGERSVLAHGVSEWQTFEHNASPPIVTATWNEVFAIQANGGGIHPALLVGMSLQPVAPVVTQPDATTIVQSYSGLSPNEDIQLNLASFGISFYPPDPVHVLGNRIEVDLDNSGTMFTLVIDITSTSGELLDPATIVGFNPQPEPPAGSIYAFNPQPEPPAGDPLAIFVPLMGGVGAPGATQITLSLEVLDEFGVALPISQVAVAVPSLGGWGQVVLGCLLIATALRTRGKALT